MSEFLSLVVTGAVAGALYAILASGLVLTYQTSGILNFAHGAVAFTTAFVFFQLHQPAEAGGQGWPIVPAAIASVVLFAPLFGALLDRIVLRRLSEAPETARVVGTVGLLVALPALVLLLAEQTRELFGWRVAETAQVFNAPGLGPVPPEVWTLRDGVVIDSDQLAIFLAAVGVALVLWFLLRHTRLGLETRAAVDRKDLATLRGIDTGRVSMAVWMLSFGLAGLAGVLLAPLFQLEPFVYSLLVFASFTAVAFARMRSVPLAFAGGLLLGVIQNLVFGYAPRALKDISGFQTAVPFVLLLVFVVVVGGTRRGRAAGVAAEERARPDHRAGLSPLRKRLPWAIATVALAAWTLFVADDFWAGRVAVGLVFSLIFLSFVVVTGMGGMISLAQATFVTAGGMTAGWLLNHTFATTSPLFMNDGRVNFFVAAAGAAALAALVGVLVAMPSLRLGGLALALATLALAFIGDQVIFQLETVRNGSQGWSYPAPQIGPFDLGDERTLAMFMLVVLLIAALVLSNLQNSASGRSIFAVRSSEVAARTSGLSPVRSKLALFAVSAAIAGFGGAMLGVASSPFTNRTATAFVGIVWLAVAATFGVRRAGGAIIAGLVFVLSREVLTTVSSSDWGAFTWIPADARSVVGATELPLVLFGLGAIALAREPDGILALTGARLRERRRKPAEKRPDRAPAPEAADRVVPGPSPEPSADALVRVEDLHAGYGEVEVLHGIDLTVGPGEVVALLGPNGAGKSTLCATVAGLIVPRSGRVLLGGRDLTGDLAHTRARAGLVLAPEGRGIFAGLTVDENLAVWLRSRDQRDEAYTRFPLLADRRRQEAGLLSGGEQQILAVASLLVRPPRVLVIDEPSLGLAPLVTEQVFELLASLREREVAVLLVEQKAHHALALADTVAVLNVGRLVWHGPRAAADVDALSAAYLGGD